MALRNRANALEQQRVVLANASELSQVVLLEIQSVNYLLNLNCDDSAKANQALFIVFSVPALLSLLCTVVSDNFGRKATFYVAATLNFFGVFLALAKADLDFIVMGLVLQVLGRNSN